jgi:hypothetical protein
MPEIGDRKFLSHPFTSLCDAHLLRRLSIRAVLRRTVGGSTGFNRSDALDDTQESQ